MKKTESSINERIKILVKLLEKDNQRQFAHKIKADPVTINNIIQEKQKDVKAGILANIIEAYPTVNVNYLISGIGEPLEKFSVKALMDEINSMGQSHANICGGLTKQIGEMQSRIDSLLVDLEEERNKRDELLKKYVELVDNLVKHEGNIEAIVIDLYPKEQVTHEVTLAV